VREARLPTSNDYKTRRRLEPVTSIQPPVVRQVVKLLYVNHLQPRKNLALDAGEGLNKAAGGRSNGRRATNNINFYEHYKVVGSPGGGGVTSAIRPRASAANSDSS
jgi:hypothetical protein